MSRTKPMRDSQRCCHKRKPLHALLYHQRREYTSLRTSLSSNQVSMPSGYSCYATIARHALPRRSSSAAACSHQDDDESCEMRDSRFEIRGSREQLRHCQNQPETYPAQTNRFVVRPHFPDVSSASPRTHLNRPQISRFGVVASRSSSRPV